MSTRSSFAFHGWRIVYTEFGGGPAALTPSGQRGTTARKAPARGRPLIMVHGVLLGQTMHWPLAEDLAALGNRVITIDLLGHGASDRPRELARYTMGEFSQQIEALMDHLELEEAAIMGTSLGTNAALELACRSPERLRGLILEMPVLEGALVAGALTFTPMLLALMFGEPVLNFVSRAARAVPRRVAAALRQRAARRGPRGPLLRRLRASGVVLRKHRAGGERAPPAEDARARARPSPRPSAPVLGRRHACLGDAERAARRGKLARGAAPEPRAPDARDRGVPGRGLGRERPDERRFTEASQATRHGRGSKRLSSRRRPR